MENMQEANQELPKRLHESLQGLIGLHRQLYEVVKAENEAITAADTKATYEATANKEALIHWIREAESLRQRIVSEIQEQADFQSPAPSLKEIILYFQGSVPAIAERLQADLHALLILVERIKAQNQANGRLVEASLKHIHQMKSNIFGETTHQGKTYNQMGQKNPGGGHANGPRLISKEV